MSSQRIAAFIEQVFTGFHKKRQQTLAVLVGALVTVGKVGVASLGRAIRSRVAPKHRIQQVDRCLANDKIQVVEWCAALLAMVVGERRSIRIAIDWTKVGPWPVLVASVVIQRRGIPVYWATCDWRKLTRSQNAFEETFLTVLRAMIPKDVDVTLLFDRGFRRVALARQLKELGFHFVVRCPSDTRVVSPNWSGPLSDLPLPRGRVRDLGHVLATVEKPEDLRLVAIFDHGQKDAWYLFTDLDLPACEIVRLYGRRFTIEEVFRDKKSTRYGWSLGEYRLKDRPDRLDRLILVIASACFLVSWIGHCIEAKGLDRLYKANTVRTRTHGPFQMGWKGHRLVRWLPLAWLSCFARLAFDLDIRRSVPATGGAV
ncbi:MAG TPA: IS4 family transposase [Myxococcota bacterium]|nr:IS4 family transposase [Myxococcota bacterium]